MHKCGQLQALDLSENELTDTGVKAIAAGVKYAKSLEMLNLRENEEITEKGGNAVVKGTTGCPQLRHLDLGGAVVLKNIGDEGVAADGLLSH